MLKQLVVNDDGTVKPAFVYTILVVAILVAGYIVVRVFRTETDRPIAVQMMCWTEGCGYTQASAPKIGDQIPAKCPKCGNDTLAPSYTCPRCGKISVWNCYRGVAEPDKCAGCGQEVRYGF